MAATVEQARTELAGGADVAGVSDPFATGTAAVSADGQTAYLDVSYAVDKLTTAQLDDALAVRDAARDGGVQVELTGGLAMLQTRQPPLVYVQSVSRQGANGTDSRLFSLVLITFHQKVLSQYDLETWVQIKASFMKDCYFSYLQTIA